MAPLGYFLHSAGPAAHPVLRLGWVYAGICVAVCLLVAFLLAIAIFRRRPRESAAAIRHGAGGLGWVYAGTILSSCVLFAMAVYMLAVLNGIAAPPAPPRLSITVTGYQWWWEAVYDGDDPARRFATANEIHIPAGEPVLFRLRSADVIHAFWVPALGGKTQMIPGQINRQWLQADKPGVYRGQCVQYCGVQHAHMGFEIVAQPPEEFRAWERAQRAKARALPAAGKIPAGARLFLQACAACHTVRGSAAAGAHGPDLTHLASRRSIAAALLPNTAENLRRWILHAQGMKPGVRMPDFPLTARQRDALVAYLQSLK